MYLLNRILVSRFGHATAYFPGTLVRLHPPGSDEPVSTLLSAMNGAGKTTLVSAILSVFEPRAQRFIQHLQKPAHHFHHYVREQPGVVALELIGPKRQGRTMGLFGDANEPDHDTLVVGYVCHRRGTDVTRRFFVFAPFAGLGLDDLPWPGTSASPERHVTTSEEATRWLHECAALRFPQAPGFEHVPNQDVWIEKLRARNVPVEMLAAQVDLARTEGGLDRIFSQMRSDKQALRFLMGATGIAEFVERRMEQFKAFTKDIAKVATLDGERAMATRLEESLAEVEAARLGHANAQRGLGAIVRDRDAMAAGLRRVRSRQIAASHAAAAEAAREETEARAQTQVLRVASADAEAARVAIAEAELSRVLAAITASQASARQAEVAIGAVEDAFALERVAQAGSDLARIEQRINYATAEQSQILEPLRREGGRIRAWLEASAAGLSTQAEDLTVQARELTERANESRIEVGRRQTQAEALGRRIRDGEAASEALASLLAEGRSSGLVTGEETPEEAYRRHEQGKDDARFDLNDAVNGMMAAERALGQATSAERAAEVAQGVSEREMKDAQGDLARRVAAIGSLASCEAVKAVLGEAPADPCGDEAIQTLGGALSDRRSGRQAAADRQAALRTELASLERGFAFDDPAAERVVEILKQAGLDAGHAPHWISDTLGDPAEARRLIESDPARYLHGVVVRDDAEVARAQAMFDRMGWDLPRAVTVSARSHDPGPRIAGFVAGASSEIAYSRRARDERKVYLRDEVPRLLAEERKLGAVVDELAAALAAANDLARLESETPRSALEGRVSAARATLSDAVAVLDAARAEHISARAAKLAAGVRHAEATQAEEKAAERESRARDFLAIYRQRAAAVPSKADFDRLRAEAASALASSADAEREADRLAQAAGSIDRQCAALRDQCRQVLRERDGITHHEPAPAAPIADAAGAEIARGSYRGLLESLRGGNTALEGLERERHAAAHRLRDEENRRAAALERLGDRAGDVATLSARWHGHPAEALEDRRRIAGIELDRESARLPGLLTLKGEEQAKAVPRESSDYDAPLLMQRREQAGRRIAQGEDPARLQQDAHAAYDVADVARKAAWGRSRAASDLAKSHELEEAETRRLIERLGQPVEGLDGDEPAASLLEIRARIDGWNRQWDDLSATVGRHRGEFGRRAKAWAELRQLPAVVGSAVLPGLHAKAGPLHDPLGQECLAGVIEDLGEYKAAVAHQIAGRDKDIQNVTLSVMELLDQIDERLGAALRARTPAGGAAFSGKTVLRTDVDVKAAFHARKDIAPRFVRERLPAMLDQDGRMNQTGEAFAAELVEFVLGGKPPRIEILKPVSQSARATYEPITQMTGSGGQVLTAALLFYLVVCSVRSHGKAARGFLILDNPLGAANASELVSTQLALARQLGIQLVVASGVRDPDAVGQFRNVVTWRSGRTRGGMTPVELERDSDVWPSHIGIETDVFRTPVAAE